MEQMTAGQVLAQVDDLLPNSYPGEQKRRWLRQAEGFVLEEVVRVHEGGHYLFQRRGGAAGAGAL